jgi:hypothetical protein
VSGRGCVIVVFACVLREGDEGGRGRGRLEPLRDSTVGHDDVRYRDLRRRGGGGGRGASVNGRRFRYSEAYSSLTSAFLRESADVALPKAAIGPMLNQGRLTWHHGTRGTAARGSDAPRGR